MILMLVLMFVLNVLLMLAWMFVFVFLELCTVDYNKQLALLPVH